MLHAYVSSVSNVCFKCSIWMLHLLLWLYLYVSNVDFKYFIVMLQVFHLDVAKLDLDVAYVAMPIHTCFKYFIFLGVCCKCFI